MDQEKVKKLINKLGSLSKNNSNVHEAANAAAQMQALIEKYNIREIEIGELDNDVLDEDFYVDGKNITRWKSILAASIAELNNCQIVFQESVTLFNKRKTYVKYRIIGGEDNISICSYLFNYLLREIENLCKEHMAAGVGSGKKYATAFKLGSAIVIINRLKEEKNLQRQNVNSNALVKVNNDIQKLKEYMSTKQFGRKKFDSKVNDTLGYVEGQMAGSRIPLNPTGQLGK